MGLENLLVAAMTLPPMALAARLWWRLHRSASELNLESTWPGNRLDEARGRR